MRDVITLPPDETRFQWSEIKQRRVVRDVRTRLHTRKGGTVEPTGILRAQNVVTREDGSIERRNLTLTTAYNLGAEEANETAPAWTQHASGGMDSADSLVQVRTWDGYARVMVPTMQRVIGRESTKANPKDRDAREYTRGREAALKPPTRSKILRKSAAMINAEVRERITRHDPKSEQWWSELSAADRTLFRRQFGIRETM